MARILIVDDDLVYVKTVADLLSAGGHRVKSAHDPTEAFTQMSREAPDLIIMDVQMPGGGAPYAVNLMQQSPGLAKIPTIFVSSMQLAHMKKWFPESPQRRYLNKPVEIEQLLEHIQELQPAAAPAGAALPQSSNAEAAVPLARRLEQVGKAKAADANELASRLVDVVMKDAIAAGASDIHLCPESDSVRVLYRVDGILREAGSYPKAGSPIIPRLRIMAGLSPTTPSVMVPEEGSFDFPGGSLRLRLATIPSAFGEKVTIRLLYMSADRLGVDHLGLLPADLERLRSVISRHGGIFLACGPSGSGKTMTLCSLLRSPELQSVNVATLEDPVEYRLPAVTHTQIVPAAGFTFASGLRALLRHDANVIMLGEIRDSETATLAMQAATSGHLILSTIHSMSAIGVIARLRGLEVEPYLIGNALIGALMQRLARRVCPACAAPEAPATALLQKCLRDFSQQQVERINNFISSPGANFVRGRGCPGCGGTGHKGRVGLFELFLVDLEVRKLLLGGADMNAIGAAALKAGTKPILDDALAKAAMGMITLEDALQSIV